jgi:hypothetical protein
MSASTPTNEEWIMPARNFALGLFACAAFFAGTGAAHATRPVAQPQHPVSATLAAASTTLSWLPPYDWEDGSALGDLARYRIYYGTQATSIGSSCSIASR